MNMGGNQVIAPAHTCQGNGAGRENCDYQHIAHVGIVSTISDGVKP